MYEEPTVVALRESLAGASERTITEVVHREGVLQHQVFAVVDDLKAKAWPPELVMLTIKEIAADAGIGSSPMFNRASRPLANGNVLLARMVRWTIDRYYNKDPRQLRSGDERTPPIDRTDS
jgi:hypothetical protein